MKDLINKRDHPLPIKYVKNPRIASQSELLLNRHKEKLKESLVHKQVIDEGTHKDPIVRLFEREQARAEALRL